MDSVKVHYKGRNTIKVVPSKFSYIGEFEENLPMGCIINKNETGIGGTSLELTSARHSVIIVPYSKLITEKKLKHPNVIVVMGGVKEREIAHQIKTATTYVKIMVTYDSLHKVVGAIERIGKLGSFNFLVDEYHVLLIDASFRKTAIGMLLDIVPKLDNVSFMSATPIPYKFLPSVLKKFPTTTYVWNGSNPYNIDIINSDNYLKSLKRFITKHNGNTNLHIFLNSVSDISGLLNDMKLNPSEVSVICSENEESNNQKTLGEDYKISSNIGDSKKYNFYTSIAFLGVDIDDEHGETVVVASNKSMSLRIEPSMVFTQIVGRLRADIASKRNITLIADVSINMDRAYNSYDEFKKGFNSRYRSLKRGIELWNDKSEIWKKDNPFTDTVGRDKVSLHSTYPDGDVYFDMVKASAFYFGEYLRYDVYKNPVNFFKYIKAAGFNIVSNVVDITKTDDKIKKGTSLKFIDAYQEYCSIMKRMDELISDDERSSLDKRASELCSDKRYLASTYKWLTPDEVASKEYRLKKIIPAIYAKKEAQKARDNDKILSYIIQSNVYLGEVCKISELKSRLQSLFDKMGIDVKADKALLSRFIKTNSKMVYSKDTQKQVSFIEDFSDTQTSFSFIEDVRNKFKIKKIALTGVEGTESISLLFDVNRYLSMEDVVACKGNINKAKVMILEAKERRVLSVSSNRAIQKAIATTFSVDKRYTEKKFNKEMSDITAGVDNVVSSSEYVEIVRQCFDVEIENDRKGKIYRLKYRQKVL